MEVGQRIQELREVRGWTTNKLANESGLSQSFVRSVELGEKGISVENLALLCEAMSVSLKYFFDEPQPEESLKATLSRQIEILSNEQQVLLSAFLKSLSEDQ
ncbi:MAG: helix-turn-helix transcriptional regulator [Eubacteriales bacterium]